MIRLKVGRLDAAPSPDEAAVAQDRLARTRSAIRRLPGRQREVLHLVFTMQ